ncbi:MAG: large conductance mechanosensitive channel protein MscL [Chloroflexi bacterium]|nr:MAG: large conductance mechanosensitive channel protein MscL [Chloroflexota bacterium]
MQNVWKEFKEFAFKGNLIDLAVAFVLGLAFTAVIVSLVENIIMPIIAAIFGKRNFSALAFDIGDATISYGNVINALLYFLVVAWVLFLVVKTVNRMRKPAPGVPSPVKECPYCFSSIPVQATRCPNCTSHLTE